MKLLNENNKKFQPFELTLQIDTEKEAQVLYALFNFTDICTHLCSNSSTREKIRNFIEARITEHDYPKTKEKLGLR